MDPHRLDPASDPIADLAQRVETQAEEVRDLRRRSRRDRRLFAGALAAGAALVLMGQAEPPKKTIVAQNFVLAGPNGKARGGMGQSKKGGASFWLGLDGKKRIHMTVSSKGAAAINLLDAEGKVRQSVGVSPDGLTFVAQKDAKGKIRNFMFTGPKGDPKIRLKGPDGKNLKELP